MVQSESKFTKSQIIQSDKFTSIDRDVINGILTEGTYTLEEVKKILQDFNEGEVR